MVENLEKVLEAGLGRQKLGDADALVKLSSDAVVDGGDDFAAVAAGIDVDAEGSLLGGKVDDAGDLRGDLCGGVAFREDVSETPIHPLANSRSHSRPR
ncbi:MAG TPA: hypothetical protein VGL60_01715 [Acidimicrobiales bacterium]